MNYCSRCGNEVVRGIPKNDDRERYICKTCSKIHYQNPRIVVGCIPVRNGKVLMCRRGTEPRKDKWTVPAGFLEHNETVEEGALRETQEETRLDVHITRLHTIFSIPPIGQIYMLFLAEVPDRDAETTAECSELRFFGEKDMPWEEIAFSAVCFSLERYFEDVKTGNVHPHLGTDYK